jgi:HK97 family phage portal protein
MQALRRTAPAAEERFSLTDASALEVLLGGRTVAGPVVSPSNALESPTVLACVTALAGDVGQLSIKLYRRMERGKEIAVDHPLYYLLHTQPNEEMTAGVLQETLMGHLLTWGNAYCEIEWGADGFPVALWPLLPDRMTVKRENGALLYEYRPDFVQAVTLRAWQVLHVPGLSFDGLLGYSPVRLAMQTLSGDRATAEFGWKFFANGARPGVILKHPGKLSADAAGRIRQSWNDLYGGVQNAHRAAVLEEGMDIATLGIPPDEAQFLQTRQFTKREIAAIYQVPLQRIGDLETATYASSEQFSEDYVKFSLNRWLKRFEQAIAAKLLVGEERRQYVVEFERNALIITQTTERFQAYATAIQNGVMTPNEARERENLNPMRGGDDLLLPLNMAKAGEEAEAVTDEEGESGSEGDGERAALIAAWVDDAWVRLQARVGNDVRQSGGKMLRQGGRMALSEWGEEMQHEWRQAAEKMLEPLRGVVDMDGMDTGAWVATAYQAAVKELIHE